MCDRYDSTDVLFYTAKNVAINTLNLEKGDRLVLTGGMTNGMSGNTSMIKVESV